MDNSTRKKRTRSEIVSTGRNNKQVKVKNLIRITHCVHYHKSQLHTNRDETTKMPIAGHVHLILKTNWSYQLSVVDSTHDCYVLDGRTNTCKMIIFKMNHM